MEPLKERAGSQKRYRVIMNLRTVLLKLWSADKRESASPGSSLDSKAHLRPTDPNVWG